MKTILTLSLFAAAIAGLGACQNSPQHHANDFTEKTRRTYNPETGSFEQTPPFGKQSNKTDTQ